MPQRVVKNNLPKELTDAQREKINRPRSPIKWWKPIVVSGAMESWDDEEEKPGKSDN